MLTVVSYHHFAGAPDPLTANLGVTTSPERFRAHLEFFRRWYTPVTLDAVLAGVLPERPLLVTIDDAYRSVRTVALPLLTAARIPAVLFTNPRVVAGDYVPLDNLLALAFQQLSPELLAITLGVAFVDLRSVIADVLPRLAPVGREALRARLLAALGTSDAALTRARPFLDARDLSALVGAGIAIGNHTASHVHGRSLVADADLHNEILVAKLHLEALSGTAVSAFSFPYGNLADATPNLLAALRASGHRALFLVQARANGRRHAADLWYRIPMQNDHPASLPAKLALLPRLRSWRAALAA